MKSKRILRFYFNADGLDRALDNIITKVAASSADPSKSCEYYAGRLMALAEAKGELGELWRYLDRCMAAVGEGEREVLRRYAFMRCGIRRLGEDDRREIRRCLIKFVRRARNLERYGEGLRLVNEYYCLL